MDSTPDEKTTIELYHQLSELWAKAGMHARKWLSNSSKVLREIPQEDRLTVIDIHHDDLLSTKALRVAWIAQNDAFMFRTVPPCSDLQLTKRNVLRNVASLFDPLGFVTPFSVRTRILSQEMWTRSTRI